MRKSIAGLLVVACLFLVPGSESEAQKKKKAPLKAIQPAAVSLGRPVDFEKDILPILDDNCIACHNIAIDESKLVLEDVESILKGGKRGAAVVAKQPDKSLLYKVASRGVAPAMPPLPNKVEATSLTPKELGLLRQWILEGATKGMSSGNTQVQWLPLPKNINSVFSVAVAPWGKMVAAGRTNRVSIYNANSGEEVAQLTDPALLAIQHEGKPMYSAGSTHRDFVHSLAFNNDGTMLATGGFRVVKLWKQQANARQFQLPSGPVTAVTVSAGGKWAAVGSADKSIKLWNLTDGKPGKTLAGHTANVTGLAFNADGTKLVSASTDKTIRVWNVADGVGAGQLTTTAAINAIALNKDATLVVAAHADNMLRSWKVPVAAAAADAEPPKPVIEMKGHTKPVTSVALLLPAGTQVVSGSEDGTVRVWTLSNGAAARSINHGAPVTAVATRPDGVLIASADATGGAKLWLASNGQAKGVLQANVASAQNVVSLTEEQTVAKQLVGLADAAQKAADKDAKDRVAAIKKSKDAKPAIDKTLVDAKKKSDDAAVKVTAAKAAQVKTDAASKDTIAKAKVAADAKIAADKVVVDADKVAKAGVTAATAAKVATTKTLADAKKATDAATVKLTAAKAAQVKTDAASKDTIAKAKVADTAKKVADKAVVDADKAAKDTAAKATVAKAAAAKDKENKGLAKVAVDTATAATLAATKLTAAKAAQVKTEAASKDTIAKAKVADTAKKAADKAVLDTDKIAKAAVVAATAAKVATDKISADAKKKTDDAAAKLAVAKAAQVKTEAASKDTIAKAKVADTAKKAADKAVADTTKVALPLADAFKKATNAQAASVRAIGQAETASKAAAAKLVTANTKKKTADDYSKKADADLATAKKPVVAPAKAVRAIAFSADSKRLATAGDDMVVSIWDGDTGALQHQIPGHKGAVSAVAFGAGNVVVSGAADNSAVVWSANPEWKLVGMLGAKMDAPLDLAGSPFNSRILSLDFSPNGQFIATGGGDPSRSGELMIWDVQKQSLVKTIEDAHSDTVFGVQFSRDGKRIVSGAADKFVKLFDVQTGKLIKSFEGHTHHVMDVSIKADGSTIASAGADNAIKVWNVETGEQKRTISNYTKQVTSLEFIGVGENIVSCGGDATVRLHKTSNGQNYRSLAGAKGFVFAADAARDESIIAAGGQDGVLRVWTPAGKLLFSFEPPKSAEEDAQASAEAK
jgi:WD40 repeat protein